LYNSQRLEGNVARLCPFCGSLSFKTIPQKF
jgi:hypothetical protein